MIWKCQSCVECVIAFSGEWSRLFPIFSTFSSVSTYFLTAFLSSHDPEKFSMKFFLAFCNRTYYSNKVFIRMFVCIHSYRNHHTCYAGWLYFIIVSSQTAKTEHTPMGAWMIMVLGSTICCCRLVVRKWWKPYNLQEIQIESERVIFIWGICLACNYFFHQSQQCIYYHASSCDSV